MNRLRVLVMFLVCSSLFAAANGAHAQTPIPPPPGSQPPPAPKPPAPAPAPARPAPAPATPASKPDSAASIGPPITTQSEMETQFDQFYKIGLDLEHPLAVREFTLKRDTMELTFHEGTIWLAQPIGEQVTGALFQGRATIKVTIPSASDRKLFQQANGKPAFDASLSEAVLRFDDDTDRDLRNAGKPAPGATPSGGVWEDRLKAGYNGDTLQINFLENRINRMTYAHFFQAQIHTDKEWFEFEHLGRERIEDGLYLEQSMGTAGKHYYRTGAIFHRPEDYDAKGNYDLMPEADAKEPATLRNLDMQIVIPNTKSLQLDAHLNVEALRDGVRVINFDLENNFGGSHWSETGRPIKVETVSDDAGHPLPYLHRCHQLLVLLPEPLSRGARTTVHAVISEDTIIELTVHSYWIFADNAWFPRVGESGGRYTFDWTVKINKPLRATGSGDLVREWEEGNQNCAEWKSTTPEVLPAFIFGDFKVAEGSYKREPPGTGEIALRLYIISGGMSSKTNPESIFYNVGQGIKMYESIYGPFPEKQLDIAEITPGAPFSISPAGILMLTTFVNFDVTGSALTLEKGAGLGTVGGGGQGDQVLFHELAHQYWFHQVTPLGREDAWVSESWAEYSSGLMTEAIDKKKFHTQLDQWRRYANEADSSGTIATAFRSDSERDPRAYEQFVYGKGPYVVHMLRTWMGWEKFTQYVTSIQSKYRGAAINTDTLAREASKVMGYDMFPFFDQWVRDKGIPKVHYSWSAASDSEGKQVITIKTHQEDEANAKILMVPIALDFGKGAPPTVVPKPILKAQAEIQLRVPSLPKSVVLDPEETQLAVFIPDQKAH